MENQILIKTKDNKVVSKSRQEVEKFINQFLRDKENTKDKELIYALTQEDGSLLLPEGFIVDLDRAKKENKSIRQYIDVIPVNTTTGLYTEEAEGNANDELIEFDDHNDYFELAEQDIKFNRVRWDINARGSFTAVEQLVIEDSTTNLLELFKNVHAKKAVKTENKLVFSTAKESLMKKELGSLDELNKSLNKDINPALENEIVVITNQDGYELLKPQLEFYKNENGKPKAYLDKYLVETYSNDELVSNPGTIPVIYGSLKSAIKLFDMRKTEILLIRYPFGIRSRVSVIRGMNHFDVKVLPNVTQALYGELNV